MRGAPARDTTNAGTYIATVTAVTGARAEVEVPRLGRGFAYPAAGYPATGVTVGDRVAVVFLEGGRDEVVILTVLA